MHIRVQDIKTGAIYRFGAVRRWSVEQIADAIEARLGFKRSIAEQIARHWHSTDPYRIARGDAQPHAGMPRWLKGVA